MEFKKFEVKTFRVDLEEILHRFLEDFQFTLEDALDEYIIEEFSKYYDEDFDWLRKNCSKEIMKKLKNRIEIKIKEN